MLLRALGGGRSEVTTLSWWDSADAIRKFAGLLERPLQVEHHRVVWRSA